MKKIWGLSGHIMHLKNKAEQKAGSKDGDLNLKRKFVHVYTAKATDGVHVHVSLA